MSGDSLVMNLDMQGVAVSTGSACSSGSSNPSPVLTAMGYPKERVERSVRFSVGRYSTEKEINITVEILMNIYRRNKDRVK